MYQPMNIILNKKHLIVTLWPSCDAQWKDVPLRRKINPLRYSVCLGLRGGMGKKRWLIWLNEKGRWFIKWSNFSWKYLGGERRFNKKQKVTEQ